MGWSSSDGPARGCDDNTAVEAARTAECDRWQRSLDGSNPSGDVLVLATNLAMQVQWLSERRLNDYPVQGQIDRALSGLLQAATSEDGR